MSNPWRIWIDSGGTFTDCLALAPSGAARRVKVLSSGNLRLQLEGHFESDSRTGPTQTLCLGLDLIPNLPDDFFRGFVVEDPSAPGESAEVLRFDSSKREIILSRALQLEGVVEVELESRQPAPVLATRLVTGTAPDQAFPPIALRLASTRGTNALLEGKGCATALFVTSGFADLLEIGNQQRPDLFALDVRKPEPLYQAVVEVAERVAADGSILKTLDLAAVDAEALRLKTLGIEAVAVALMHSYLRPGHERAVRDRLQRAGFEHVALSSDLAARIKILPRAQTAVVDAYLSRVVGDYFGGIQQQLEQAEDLSQTNILIMTSAGGLTPAESFRPKDSLLSGPAAGVVGAATAAAASGFERFLAFDMGGTSTDVTRFEGELEYRAETEVGSVRLASPSVAIETVAAGGGSICRFDPKLGRLRVGPESAGADPGPACYGRGGPLTVTDINLLLGRLDSARFPFAVSKTAAQRRAEEVLESLDREPAAPQSQQEMSSLLLGFLEIANEIMAAGIRRTSVRRGYRPSDYGLVAFGGAGPQHACAVATLLGIETVIVPADAALLSAKGLGGAGVERVAELQVLKPLDQVENELADLFSELAASARRQLRRDGVAAEGIGLTRQKVFVRLAGQESTLELNWAGPETDLVTAFGEDYLRLFGYQPVALPLEVESLQVVASGGVFAGATEVSDTADVSPASGVRTPQTSVTSTALEPVELGAALGATHFFSTGGWIEATRHERTALRVDLRIPGPALILENHSCVVVEVGWSAAMDTAGAIVLRRRAVS